MFGTSSLLTPCPSYMSTPYHPSTSFLQLQYVHLQNQLTSKSIFTQVYLYLLHNPQLCLVHDYLDFFFPLFPISPLDALKQSVELMNPFSVQLMKWFFASFAHHYPIPLCCLDWWHWEFNRQ